jgi:hypothetical protein
MKSSISGHLLGKRSSLWRTWSSAHSGSRRRFKSGNRVGRRESAVRAAMWRTGNLELWDPRGAARGGSTRARRCPERVRGAHSGGGHGAPHGPAARVPRGRRAATSEEAHAGARERMLRRESQAGCRPAPSRLRRVCDIASAHRRMIASADERCPYSGVKCRILYEISHGFPQAECRSVAQ